MENNWLMTLLLAPIAAPTGVEAYTLYWYMLERDALAGADEDAAKFGVDVAKVELGDHSREVRS